MDAETQGGASLALGYRRSRRWREGDGEKFQIPPSKLQFALSSEFADLKLFHAGVEGGVKFSHGGFGFVAHAGKAEGGAFYFSVTPVDQKALVLDGLLQLGHVDGSPAGFGPVVDAG